MKKIICTTVAIMMLALLLTGCKVKTSVDSKYVDDFVDNYADAQIDENGNAEYEFQSKKKYDEFVSDYYEEVKEESRLEIESSGQYSYYNPEITEIVVGIKPESFDELGEEALKAEAFEMKKEAVIYIYLCYGRCIMKGYVTESGYMGYVGDGYVLFASEADYIEYTRD